MVLISPEQIRAYRDQFSQLSVSPSKTHMCLGPSARVLSQSPTADFLANGPDPYGENVAPKQVMVAFPLARYSRISIYTVVVLCLRICPDPGFPVRRGRCGSERRGGCIHWFAGEASTSFGRYQDLLGKSFRGCAFCCRPEYRFQSKIYRFPLSHLISRPNFITVSRKERTKRPRP